MFSTTTSLMPMMCLLALPAMVEAGFLRGVITPPSVKAELTTDSSFAELPQQVVKHEETVSDVDVQKPVLPTELANVEKGANSDATTESTPPPAEASNEDGLSKFMTKFSLVESDIQCVSACGYREGQDNKFGWKQCAQACISSRKPLFNALMNMLPDAIAPPSTPADEVPPELHAIKALASEVAAKLEERRKQRQAEL